jgi:hypothetical protein
MKNKILPIILFLVYNFVSGQSTFTLLISDSANDYPGDIIELSDQSFILSSEFYTSSPNQASQRFFKINAQGIITHDSIFENPNGTGTLLKLVYINDTNIFCIGDWANLGEKDQKWVAAADSGFNIHWNKKYQINYNYAKTSAAFLNSQGRIISSATATNDISRNYLYFQEYSVTGDTLISSIDSTAYGPIIFDMMEFPGNGLYTAAVSAYASYSMGQIITIDSTLKIVGVDSIPNEVYWYNSLKKINDSGYYLSGNKHPNQSYDYAIMFLNENNNCKKLSVLGQNDTIDYAGITKSMDFLTSDTIFLGATSNIALFSGHYGNQDSWFVLSNFDSDLNLRWTKYYGGDAYYMLESVVATKDGGAILVGTRYDYQTQSNICGIYLVKVNGNGVLTNDDHNRPPIVHDAIVFPNPGSDYLIIESGPQISGAQFMMTTINSKQIVSKTLDTGKITVPTQFLQSGTYVWQVVFKDRIIETGKWIKE